MVWCLQDKQNQPTSWPLANINSLSMSSTPFTHLYHKGVEMGTKRESQGDPCGLAPIGHPHGQP